MATNVRAVLHLTMLAVPHLEKTEGNVVNVSSVNGIRSFPGYEFTDFGSFSFKTTKACLLNAIKGSWPTTSPRRLADNCQILAVRSDNCQIGQLSDRTTVSADNCQIGQLSVRTTVSGYNCQWGQLSVGQLSVDHGQLSEETVSALKKL